MTDEQAEQADLEKLKALRADIHIGAFSLCRQFLRMAPGELKHYGHKTIENGIRYTIESAIKKIDKLETEHFKKWPD